MEGYVKDLGKTVPSLDGKWDKNKEYERLSIVYVAEGEEDNEENGGDNSGNSNKVSITVINTQGATVSINGVVGKTASVQKGTNVIIILSKEGYNNKIVRLENIQTPYTELIEFEDSDKKQFTINVSTNIQNATIKINGIQTSTATVRYGDSVTIVASGDLYKEKTQVVSNITENKNINIEFTNEDLAENIYTVTVNIIGDYDTCLINNQSTTQLQIAEGRDVSILVTKIGYEDQGDMIFNISRNETVNIEFTEEDRLKFDIYVQSNINGTTFKAYDENNNEIEMTNTKVVVVYGSYVRIVASAEDYLDKEIELNNVTSSSTQSFVFTDSDLAPVFRISTDGVTWKKNLDETPEIGVWKTIHFKTINNEGVVLKNGYPVTYGTVNFDSEFDGDEIYKVRINSISPNSGVGFRFVEIGDFTGYCDYNISND